jgi:hypothetical protein
MSIMAKNEISISKVIADVFDGLAEDPQRLTKVGEIPTIDVTSIVSINPFPENITSEFLKGKHSLILTGKGIGTNKDDNYTLSLIAESAKSAMKTAGIKVKKVGNSFVLPACQFTASGYTMTFKVVG